MAPVQSRLIAAAAACAAITAIAAAMVLHKKKRRRRKKIWVKKWILRRPTKGSYAMLVDELRLEDPASYKNYLRMNEDTFMELVDRVSPYVKKMDTNMRL